MTHGFPFGVHDFETKKILERRHHGAGLEVARDELKVIGSGGGGDHGGGLCGGCFFLIEGIRDRTGRQGDEACEEGGFQKHVGVPVRV